MKMSILRSPRGYSEVIGLVGYRAFDTKRRLETKNLFDTTMLTK